MTESMIDYPEFDCRECGRHIVMMGNPVLQAKHPGVCALCWSIPRWWEDAEMARTFDPDHDRATPSFTCPRCGAVSYHPKDIEHRYCGRCHVFVDDD